MLTTADPIVAAREYINNGRIQEAEQIVLTILSAHPDHMSANVLKSFITYLKGDYQTAEREIANVIAVQPLSCEAHLIHGFSLAELHRHEEAIRSLSRALSLNPTCVEARVLIAKILLKDNKSAEARAWLEEGREHGLSEVEISEVLGISEKIEWVDPQKLLHPARLDVIVKTIYARKLLGFPTMNSELDIEELYLHHIFFRTGGVEPGDEARKNSLASFKNQFETLIHSMKQQQFNPEFPIPVSRRTGLILNGAHRLAAAIALGLKQVAIVYRDDVDGLTWDYSWFLQQGFSELELNEMVRSWIEFRAQSAGCVILWSPVEAHWDEIERQINSATPIVFSRTFDFPRHVFDEVVRDLYVTDWGPIPGENIERKIAFFKDYAPRFRFLVVAAGAGVLPALKQTVRNKWHYIVPSDRFATLHTTDTPRETAYVADLFLNTDNLRALARRPVNGFRPEFLAWLAEYYANLKQLQIDPELCCIVGSSVLEAYNVRPATDVDFTMIHALREKFFTPGVTHLTSNLDVVARDYPRSIANLKPAPTDNDLIRDRHLHIRVRGFKFAHLDVVVTRKQMQRREKDLADVALVSKLRLEGVLE